MTANSPCTTWSSFCQKRMGGKRIIRGGMAPEQRPSRVIAASRGTRGEAFARLFEAVHEGVYIGTIGPRGGVTLYPRGR